MKKNLLKKIYASTAMLATCLTLFAVVLPFGTFILGVENDSSYDSSVNTCADDYPEYVKVN